MNKRAIPLTRFLTSFETTLSRKGRGGERPGSQYHHHNHRNFSVDNPASASITAMIQKRITICGSVQPSCSK
jgi:hypothetical protein